MSTLIVSKSIPISFFIRDILNHFEISGNEVKNEQSEKMPQILFTLLIFQFEISGKHFNDKQLEKRYPKLINLFVFHNDKSGNIVSDLQLKKNTR